MKTHEEIKKGLECCGRANCDGCPYDFDCETPYEACARDALAYIQQLEDAIDKTTQLMQSATEVVKKSQEQLESTYSQVKKALCGKENVSLVEVLEAVDQLKSRLAQVERERDEMEDECRSCGTCNFLELSFAEYPCNRCVELGKRRLWQWRGVCHENTKEDDHA